MRLYGFIFAIVIAVVALVFGAPETKAQDGAADVARSGQTVLVGGATGRTGFRIVQILVAQGYNVRGMTRDPEKAREEFGNDIDWVIGDVRDPDTLETAFEGVSKYINAIGTEARRGPNSAEQVNYLGTKNLVDAAKRAGVTYFGLISSGGVKNAAIYIKKGLNDGATWRFKGEEYLRASGLTYTIVRAGALRDFPAGENGIVLLQKDVIAPGLITRSDLAQVMAECLSNPGALNKTFAVVNYLAINPEAWRDALDRLDAD